MFLNLIFTLLKLCIYSFLYVVLKVKKIQQVKIVSNHYIPHPCGLKLKNVPSTSVPETLKSQGNK